jgi:hypothetical protein
MMNLALLPDWNSLDSVRRAHSDLELAAIVFFALLVVMEALAHSSKDEKRKHLFDTVGIWFFAVAVICELLAYRYGQRDDFLSASVIISLDTKAGDAFTRASQADDLAQSASGVAGDAEIKAKGADSAALDAHKEAKWAFDLATNAANALAPRALTDAQVKTVAGKLSTFVGQPFTVTAYWDSRESMGIANQIFSALEIAGWAYSDEGSQSRMLGGEIGVMVWTHPKADARTQEAAQALIAALNAEGIEASARTQNPQNPISNTIGVNVGAKR